MLVCVWYEVYCIGHTNSTWTEYSAEFLGVLTVLSVLCHIWSESVDGSITHTVYCCEQVTSFVHGQLYKSDRL